MRLLQIATDGRLRWAKEYIGNEKAPDYAIISHTWGEQEVIFDDLKNLDSAEDIGAKSKAGWDKIRFCAQQTKRDGLDHFWVDTCCIDKSNSQELQEAINSMFRWYQNAKKCYVYLSDVEYSTSDAEGESGRRWKPAFRKSRWFTRGWTLQELLAPASVSFYSKEGELLGDKQSLKDTIHEITGIPVEALSGSRLSNFSVDDRFSWAEKRRTTREEDRAYCLLGIFGVHLPLIYSEGEENAFYRLRDAIATKGSKGRSRSQEERLGKICSWLSAPDPSTNYHKAHKQRQAETGLWLLRNARFAEWKERPASRLWLYGIPGCGKTILSSTVIGHLLQHCHDDASMVTAYFYFDFNDIQKQNPELLLRSLLCQLLQRSITIPNGVDLLFLACDNGKRQPSLHALLEVISQMIQQFTHAYIVLDALDECTQRQELMEMLETVIGWQLDSVHLLMTSRKERDIESSLESYVKEEDAICLQRDVVDRDIQQYVQQRLSKDKTLAKWNKDAAIRQEIEAALMHGARGMFRWAVCQLDTLGKCCNRAMLRKSLAALPRTLDQTYDRILCAINEEYAEYAMRILQWLTFSARPLSVEEIAEVVAIDVARELAFDRDEVLEDPLEALSICSSLVTVTANEAEGRRPAQRIIALAHYSVQEYLVSDRIKQGQAKQYSMQEVACHNALTKGCLMYLTQFQRPLSTEVLEASALARYAAQFWSSHLRNTGNEREGSLLALIVISADNPAYLNWVKLYDPDRPWAEQDLGKGLESVATPLYYAALLGLSTVTKLLLDKGANVNAQGGKFGNALYAASLRGHEQVVQMLLDKSADVNARGAEYSNALQAASAGGHEQVVKMLLDKGVEVNAQGGVYGNALQAASFRGYERVVEMLLNKGANVNAKGGFHGSALQAASARGHEQVVQMLLDKSADVNAQGTEYGNALCAASLGCHEQVVKMLLDKDADVNVQAGRRYGSALQAASERGYERVVEMLLNKGANVNVKGGFHGNALLAASAGGHEQVAKMLLEKGAEVNAQGGRYGSALQAASEGGHKEVVRILLDEGADLGAQGGNYGNALQAASAGDASTDSAEQVIKMLLDKGADVNMQGGPYGNALQAASLRGREQVVKILLDKGADVNAQGGLYGSALKAALIIVHNEQVIEMLLNKGADVVAQGGYQGNTLQAASASGNERVVEIALDKGADVNAQGGYYGNALQAASAGGHEQVVKMLLDKGADVNAQGGHYGNALQAASAEGHEQVVKMLLDAGAHQPKGDEIVEELKSSALF